MKTQLDTLTQANYKSMTTQQLETRLKLILQWRAFYHDPDAHELFIRREIELKNGRARERS